ncbi:AcrR family transcriptional regulator [Crossiella equi]|uniref:AcrR family transcriptional regulator n=1 Tax=Crossiella equi TaxID=130796 RepID=A0ABS5ADL0_9PSEU|nr:TetR/AcrR family transcriptional regulator [Crossiella equi]MBP2474441.1 AcrR family transcriptional regulator [Crossiella equi]
MTSAAREKGVRGRTRRAILDAAITVLATRPTASMADIADAAEVGRSTLHRYFPERSELLTAILRDTVARLGEAVEEARLYEGGTAQALRRAVHAYFELTPAMLQVCGEGLSGEADWFTQAMEEAEQPLRALLRRGQEEGYLDGEARPEWLDKVFWYTVLAGIDAIGNEVFTKQQAAEAVIRRLEKGLLA